MTGVLLNKPIEANLQDVSQQIVGGTQNLSNICHHYHWH